MKTRVFIAETINELDIQLNQFIKDFIYGDASVISFSFTYVNGSGYRGILIYKS